MVLERIDLEQYLVNKDKPFGPNYSDSEPWSGWSAGDQLGALRFYLSDAVELLGSADTGGYQGSQFAVLRVGGRIVLWRDSYGSCSGCDGLENSNGLEYITGTLQEGNTRQFESVDEARAYVESSEDYFWKECRESELVDKLFSFKSKN